MTSLEETRVERLPVVEIAEPLLGRSRALDLSSRTVFRVVGFGRLAVVWLPVYGLLAGRSGSFPAGIGASLVVSTVFVLALRWASSAARLALPARGAASSLVGGLAGIVLASAIGLWFRGLHLHPRVLLELAAGIFVLAATWEYLVRQTLVLNRRVLIVGANDGGSELIEDLSLLQESPFDIVGVVDDERQSEHVAGAPLLGRIADLPEIIERERPDLVVVAVAQNRLEAFGRLLGVATSGFRVVELPQFYEQAFGRVPVRRLTAAWFMSVLHLYQRPYTRFAKRTFDIAVAGSGILLTAPLFVVLAGFVKLSKGPLIFRQVRLGEGGRHFTIYKFRTMRDGAEEPGRPIWAEERDPRVTSTGRLMRRSRLDELPQLWNVLRGEMSVVGPRPERPEFVELLEDTVPYWSRRHLVKPGITGWAQVSCGYTADAESTVEKLSYDLWYLRHRSLSVDLGICAKTFAALLSGSGAR